MKRVLVLALALLPFRMAPSAAETPPLLPPSASAPGDTSAHRAEAMRRYESLLANPSPSLAARRDELAFRLGILYLESAQAAAPSGGVYGSRSEYQRAIGLFDQVLARSDTIFREDALYFRAIALEETGRHDEAIQSFQTVLRDFPAGTHAAELWFRAANEAVQKNRIAEAQNAYQEVLRRGEPRYRDQASYMFAWTSFSLHQDARARTTLVDLLTRLEASGLESDSLYGEGVELLAKVVRSEGDPVVYSGPWAGERPRFVKTALRRTADLFRETSAFADAARAYEQLLREYPDLENRTEVEKLVVESYLKAENLAGADAARQRIVDHHLAGGTLDPGRSAEVAPLLRDSALYRHKVARETRDGGAYRRAIDTYEAYAANLPDGPARAEAIFFQAEASKEAGDLAGATERYRGVAESRDAAHGEESAFRRIALLEDLKNQGRASASQVLAGYEDYFRFYPTGPHEIELRARQAGYLFEEKRYADALAAGGAVVSRMPDTLDRQRLKLLLARAAFAAGDYPQSANWTSQLVSERNLPTDTRAIAEDIHATAIYKLAEVAKDRPGEAASQYELLARLYPRHKTAPAALYNAAVGLREGGQKARALALFRKVADSYPTTDLARDATIAATQLHQQLGDRTGAAEMLERAAARTAGSPESAELLFQAASQLRDAGSHPRTIELYRKFLDVHRVNDLRAAQARQAIAKSSLALGRETEAERYALEAVSRAPIGLAGEEAGRAQLVLAESRLVLGEIALRRFERVRLVDPIPVNLKRKQQAMEEALRHLQEAAGYGFADVSLASSYKIGYAQLGFANSLMQSPRPRRLTPEESRRYEELLREQVKPYREGAEQAFRRTLEQARTAGIENEWTARARGALAEIGAAAPLVSGG